MRTDEDYKNYVNSRLFQFKPKVPTQITTTEECISDILNDSMENDDIESILNIQTNTRGVTETVTVSGTLRDTFESEPDQNKQVVSNEAIS